MSSESPRKMNGILSRLSTLGELLSFLWEYKMWWMIPMIVVLLLFVVLLVFASGSPIAPFIYSLF